MLLIIEVKLILNNANWDLSRCHLKTYHFLYFDISWPNLAPVLPLTLYQTHCWPQSGIFCMLSELCYVCSIYSQMFLCISNTLHVFLLKPIRHPWILAASLLLPQWVRWRFWIFYIAGNRRHCMKCQIRCLLFPARKHSRAGHLCEGPPGL